jgi:hypothetical protein
MKIKQLELEGYIVPDGSALSRETYSGLYAAIDKVYGEGNEIPEANKYKLSTQHTARLMKDLTGRGLKPVACMFTEERALELVSICKENGMTGTAKANKKGIWYVLVEKADANQ